jgi:hypothetical protein
MLQRTKLSAIPKDLDEVPTVITYKYRQQNTVPVHICNITTRTVAVPPRGTLCELLAVNIKELPSKVGTSDPRLNLSHIDTGNVTSDEYDAIGKFLHQNQDLFSWRDTDIGHVTAVEHSIDLSDETPFKQRTRRIPPSMYQEV